MGPAGAAAVALLALLVGGLGAALVVAAWIGMRTASSNATARWARTLSPVGLVVLALGAVLPKSMLRALEFESLGRLVMLAAALAGAVAAALALRHHESGAGRALVCHLYFAALASSPVGEAVFGVFRML